jgi:hypothetical protein
MAGRRGDICSSSHELPAGARHSSGTPEQIEQAARLAFKGTGRISLVGATAGKQSHDPESREQQAQLRHMQALTGIEAEAVKEGFSINARMSSHGYVLGEVSKLCGPVTTPGSLKVHQVHAVSVP